MRQLVMMALIVSQFGMTGCTTMNSSFDCPNKAGVNCKSLDQINGMVDTGEIHGRTRGSVFDAAKGEKSEKSADRAEFQSFPMSAAFMPGQPIRYGETVQRIWIAPYEDTEGNYHQDSLMYSIMKGGHWIGRPVKPVYSF
jgi:conjugal transfer pilus assembly protein TraV